MTNRKSQVDPSHLLPTLDSDMNQILVGGEVFQVVEVELQSVWSEVEAGSLVGSIRYRLVVELLGD